MPKGYWIAHIDVREAGGYEEYRKRNAVPFAKFGARFLVRNGESVVAEGSLKPRHVVIEFDSYEKALACYHSPEYREAMTYRAPVSSGDLVIIAGYDGPQPG